ncbi:hypothetical protein HZB90_02330 [archaeon]|nr:hypothetical protein [archaeon]
MNYSKKIVVIFLILLIAGCSTTQAPAKKTVTQRTVQENPEDVLVNEIADGKIVEVYEEYVRIGPGEMRDNWLIIKNANDNKEAFKVYPCGGCTFEKETFEIEPGRYEITKFSVSGPAGQKEIKVKDHLNNAYGYAKINVIIE